jgi:hypothetical protein
LPFSSWEKNKCCGDKKKVILSPCYPCEQEKIKKLIKLKKLKKNN